MERERGREHRLNEFETRKLNLRNGRSISFSGTDGDRSALVMGIVNCTPDSFYPESRMPDPETAAEAALRMIREGADLLDIGGESTRPGSDSVDPEEQLRRIVPVIRAIREASDIPVSVDTRSVRVAEAAFEAGADILNDVSALTGDPDMARFAAREGVPVVLMHMRGTPKTMQEAPFYEDVVPEIIEELSDFMDRAGRAGIGSDRIILDPGIGFGKRLEDNLAVLHDLSAFRALGCPIMVGLSRKGFIGTVTGRPVGQRLAGTLAAEAWALYGGADILRVHDVGATVDLVRMHHAIRSVGRAVDR